jgi:hypothetical protein
MYSIEVACPNCHKHFQVEFEDGITHASKGIYVRCDHCGVEKRLAAFQKELHRQAEAPLRAQKSADKARRARERQEQREQRRTQRTERKRLAQKEAERKADDLRCLAEAKPTQVDVQRVEATHPLVELQQAQAAPRLVRVGVGCPRCGSPNIHQKRYTSGAGWAFFVLGCFFGLPALFFVASILLASSASSDDAAVAALGGMLVGGPCIVTSGVLFLLCLAIASCLGERRAHCRNCRWSWKV